MSDRTNEMRPSEQWAEPPRGVAHVPGAAERIPGKAQPYPTRAEAQVDLILRAFGGGVGRGPTDWRETGVQYLFREHHLLVVDEYVEQVRRLLDGAEVGNALIRGVTLLRVKEDTLTALARVREAFGSGVAAPDYVISVSGDAFFCPATEPEVVPGWTVPDPGLTADHAAGEGVRVVVVDTGFDPAAAATHPWLTGVSGDPDPAIMGGSLGPYAGHGTFIAGVVRCLAPKAEVIVRAVFNQAGATFESDLVMALDDVVSRDFPDVISMSAGTWTFDATGPLGLTVFNETRLRHHKGVAMVVAAGNDASRQPFWPAAAPWTVSVGALASNWRSRASFSNFGGWVDVYAPGEDLVNAFPNGTYAYHEPPLPRPDGQFDGMARWDGTSFSTPVVAGLVAARMSHTGENARDAASALLLAARSATLPGVGPVLIPE
jgi:subtilisin family serine protease